MIRQILKRLPAADWLNQIIKARLQERYASRHLAHYELEAKRRGVRVLRGGALMRALRLRIGSKTPKKELRIFLAYRLQDWEAVLPRALEPFGRVTVFQWTEPGGADHMLDAFKAAGRVDAVVGYLSGQDTAPEVLAEMSHRGAVIFNFCWDDKLKWPGPIVDGRHASPAGIAHAVDLNLTNAPSSLVKYAVHGGLAMFWPEAAHPDVHRPFDVPFEFDVGFVGARYSWRPRFIAKLERLGVPVICFGSGWPRGRLSDEEMVRLYSRCRINLGFGGIGHSRSLLCLKGRDFEVPMSGGLYVTQHNPELESIYDIGNEIVTYRDEGDCARKIKAILADPERATSIRRAGRIRALRDHTYEARWSAAFRIASLIP